MKIYLYADLSELKDHLNKKDAGFSGYEDKQPGTILTEIDLELYRVSCTPKHHGCYNVVIKE